MATLCSNSTTKHHIRAISLPSRTHPTTQRVEEELKKLKSWEEASIANAGDICYGLSALQELYESVDDFLNTPLNTQTLSHHQKEKWVDELLDKSVRVLDICGVAKDIVSQCKENVRDLQSSLRRRKGSDSTIETSITKYFSSRRKIKKDAKRLLACLKQIDQANLDDHASAIIRVLQEMNSTSISIFQAVFKFLSVRSYKQKTDRWALVARLVQKGRVGCEDQLMESSNEMQNADAALLSLRENDQSEMGRVHILQNRMQVLEGSLEGLENQLEVMFRCLIRSRSTLLNAFLC